RSAGDRSGIAGPCREPSRLPRFPARCTPGQPAPTARATAPRLAAIVSSYVKASRPEGGAAARRPVEWGSEDRVDGVRHGDGAQAATLFDQHVAVGTALLEELLVEVDDLGVTGVGGQLDLDL